MIKWEANINNMIVMILISNNSKDNLKIIHMHGHLNNSNNSNNNTKQFQLDKTQFNRQIRTIVHLMHFKEEE